jgi:hypothetical protein
MSKKDEPTRFVRVEFIRFKAFKRFNLSLRHFNILVGPNNAGKSTILAAFRILAAGMRRAYSRKAEVIKGPIGLAHGYPIDLSSISVAEENLFFNYDESEPATVRFQISNKNELVLYFPERGSCFLIAEANGKSNHSPSNFRSNFNCQIGFVPILGPLEHNENLFEKEAARLALFNYRAARNFRNIWYHFPEKFDDFRAALKRTWPGMDNRSDFAVVTIDGFNPERVRNLKIGMETTLGGKILAAAILDKDYRSEKERIWIEKECASFCNLATISGG